MGLFGDWTREDGYMRKPIEDTAFVGFVRLPECVSGRGFDFDFRFDLDRLHIPKPVRVTSVNSTQPPRPFPCDDGD
jgi:hypothetical protein